MSRVSGGVIRSNQRSERHSGLVLSVETLRIVVQAQLAPRNAQWRFCTPLACCTSRIFPNTWHLAHHDSRCFLERCAFKLRKRLRRRNCCSPSDRHSPSLPQLALQILFTISFFCWSSSLPFDEALPPRPLHHPSRAPLHSWPWPSALQGWRSVQVPNSVPSLLEFDSSISLCD